MHDAMMETLAQYRMERAKELIRDAENLFENGRAIRAEITVHTMLFFIQCVRSWLWMELIIKSILV